jgi:hypothetical protein
VEAAELTMVCPSRGRPGNIVELTQCWSETGAQARLLVLVDDDDPELDGYLHMPVEPVQPGERPRVDLRVIEEPRRLGPILNSVMPAVAQHGGAVGFLGDDHRPRTPGWDKALVEALPGVAYGNDLFQGRNLPTAVVMSAGIVQALGYFIPPGLIHLYMDDFWLTLGRELGSLTYLQDVIIEHMHPVAGKAGWDDGYTRVNSAQQFNTDSATYQRFMTTQWPGDLALLRTSRWRGE